MPDVNRNTMPDYVKRLLDQIGPLDHPHPSPPLKLPYKGTAEMHSVCIISAIRIPCEDDLARARLAAMGCFRMGASNWRVICGDEHGIDAEIAKTCTLWGIPLLVCGTSVQPKNSVSRRYYQRVIASGTAAEKMQTRNQFMLGLADRVVYIQEGVSREQLVDVWTGVPAL